MKKLKNEELGRMSSEEFQAVEKFPVRIILDDVRSAMNVGSVFRTSDAFKVEKIHLCGITAKPPHREINKTALGAQDTVDWVREENTLACCKNLQAEGFKIIAVEQADESTSLENFKINTDEKYAFIFGNEVFGVNEELVQSANEVLEIPQFGTKHSLNISVSVGVILWDFVLKNLNFND